MGSGRAARHDGYSVAKNDSVSAMLTTAAVSPTLISAGISPIVDAELTDYLANQPLNLIATLDADASYASADYIVIATPTNYHTKTNRFDTSTIEAVTAAALAVNPDARIVIRSTIPVGFTDQLQARHPGACIIFSPEFLREGRALIDNLHPSRIVVGDRGPAG